MIQIFSPTIGPTESESIAAVLKSGWLGKGAKVAEFEAVWAQHINVDPANVVSTNSCTEALFTAVRLLGIRPGDEVIIPTIHFIGAAQAVLAAGATPVFCDVDSRTLNATFDDIQRVVNPKRTRAIILNHYGGVPCSDIEAIKDYYGLAGIAIIEDAACAPASTYNGQAGGTFGDIGCWSFDAMKIITTGDGGMMYIRDPELADKARKMLYLGISSESGLNSDKPRWWEFDVEIEGTRRSVMNDIAAAMGIEQLKRLLEFVAYRADMIALYNELLPDEVQVKIDLNHIEDSYYFYWIQTPRRDELAKFLRSAGIYTTFRYYPLHWAYDTDDDLPNAERTAHETLLLPLHCNLSDEDVNHICEKVKEFYAHG